MDQEDRQHDWRRGELTIEPLLLLLLLLLPLLQALLTGDVMSAIFLR